MKRTSPVSRSGRFAGGPAADVAQFTESISFDRRLWRQDIAGSLAHATMLREVGLLTRPELRAIINGLEVIAKEIRAGKFQWRAELEDVHMNIEAALVKKIGAAGKKLHTARSRNDQVATDLCLWVSDTAVDLIEQLGHLELALVHLAEAHPTVVIPGYTHLQRAQPVAFAHHCLAYVEMLERDYLRFATCCGNASRQSPLGSGAIAGSTLRLNRAAIAKQLGFAGVTQNSMDAVSNRDFVLDFLYAAAVTGLHLSRLAEDLILWSSAEFGFITIGDAYTTGSSLMPQKKNPDLCELTRGKTGRLYGNLVAVLTMLKGLPLTYNRDMQEDKPALFDAVDTLKACIEIYTAMLPRLKINKEILYRATTTGFLNATDLADYLVTKGMTFRESHSCVGKAVGYASSRKKELHELTIEEMKSFSTLIAEDIFGILTPEEMINRRTSFGGTARENVKAAIQSARKRLSGVECP